MSLFSHLPLGAKAAAGIAVATLAAAGSAMVVVAGHQPSTPQQHVFLVVDTASSTTASSTDSSTTSDSSAETTAATTDASTSAPSAASSTSSSHGDAVTSAVAACKAERATGGPQPRSGHSTRGIGQCVARVASHHGKP